MHSIDALMTIESDFIRLLKAIPLRELQFNGRLRQKTRQIATLLAKVAHLRRALEKQGEAATNTNREVAIEGK